MCAHAHKPYIQVPGIVYGIWFPYGQAISLQTPEHLREDSEGKRAWQSLSPFANFKKVWWASWKSIDFRQDPHRI